MGENAPRQPYHYNFWGVLIQNNLTCIKFEWATINTKPVDYLNFILSIDLKKINQQTWFGIKTKNPQIEAKKIGWCRSKSFPFENRLKNPREETRISC